MQQDKTHITVKIPYDLARYATWQRHLVNKYETNQVIKALDTWLVLKHETTSGHILGWNKQKQWLLQICKCSESIFRHRLRQLAALQLVKFDRHNIQICSWQTFAERLNIDLDRSLTIQYNIYDKQRLQEWIIAAEIEDNQNRQDYVLAKKLEKNPETKLAFTAALIAAGADRARLNDTKYFLTWMRICYTQDFLRVSDIHDLLIEYRPDNNRSVKGMANAWKCKHAVTVSYWKKVLKKTGIIDVASLQIESEERARNKYCRVLWLPGTKQTLLCMCDQITIMKPWEALGRFQAAA